MYFPNSWDGLFGVRFVNSVIESSNTNGKWTKVLSQGDIDGQSWDDILVTGATGKVGQVFIKRLLVEPKFNSFTVRALCHNRELDTSRTHRKHSWLH